MHEILRGLPPGSFALDLGCRDGSYLSSASCATTIRFDRESPVEHHDETFVCGDAAHLPFADGTFAAVIANHSLEHFVDFEKSLREIGRVLRPEGALFVSVPLAIKRRRTRERVYFAR
jgi:ubiquinone/menaquinone biosynthesis C-methylase UbiE